MTFVFFLAIGGVLFLGKVWGKVRPMIEIKDGTAEYHAGISHTEKEGMVPVAQKDIIEPSTFEVGDGAFAGLCNKSTLKIKYGELGLTSDELDKKILAANEKLRQKVTKRSAKK